MKKTLYFLLLFICACIFGGVIGTIASGSFAWLGYSRGISLDNSTFSMELFSVTFGFTFNINIAQIICIIIAIYAYIKTAPKLITSK
ncbi:MAG: DUF4321 domain-containing protein [Ruminococcus sp.]|uniref:DUF4321 domain-containing protein n=1 Tax=Ruminococcus sp. TaxID=41978 RepID=UPI001B6BFC11|nr:DUF4321 domain-containing protein [Ruminococcus sp.]MBP5579996.1 DUF4321 domain-containing protein [Ruminococcus sp.]